jgi:hypothetical protein
VPSDDVAEFGGWPQPPRWVWAVAGVAAVAVLVGVVVTHTGPRHAATSPSVRSTRTSARGPAARWPSARGACGWPVYLPQMHLARRYAGVHGRVLVGGTGLREVTLGRAMSRLPGLPDHGRLVTKLVAGPGAVYAAGLPCSSPSPSLSVYRIAAGTAHRLSVAVDDVIGGPYHAWAVTYRARHTLLTPLAGGPVLTLKPGSTPFADTAAGLLVVVHRDLLDLPDTLELVDPNTGAPLRRFTGATPLGASGHVALVSLHDCGPLLTDSRCTLESIDLTTGRPVARFRMPAGRIPISDAVFNPGGTEAAFLLARARQDPRFSTGLPYPPADVVVLHLHTGGLDIVPGLELPPAAWAGLAFDATGRWLLTTVSQGERGELLAWRRGMRGPALVTTLPGPIVTAPPLLPALSLYAQRLTQPVPGPGAAITRDMATARCPAC